jgi:hypothetical protein
MSNTFRPVHRELTTTEQKSIDAVKDAAVLLETCIMIATPNGRHRSLAMTKLEEAVMWAVKGATS